MQHRLFHTLLCSSVLTLAIAGFSVPTSAQQIWKGRASWYGPGLAGNYTANGERFNPKELTAAHASLPFGTQVRVTNLNNGRSVIVRINDRMGHGSHWIDLSTAAAQAIDMINAGIASVQLEVLPAEQQPEVGFGG